MSDADRQTLLEAEEKMDKAVSVAKDDFGAIRTGRATPTMFNKIVADYYGALTPVNQLASFQNPEARMIIVSPYDKGALRAIEKAIRDSDLGVNPTTTATIIRVVFPELTEERRKEFIKVAQDQGRGRADLDAQHPPPREGSARQAAARTATRARTTCAAARRRSTTPRTKYVAQVDELLKHKEAELLEV